VLRYTRPDTAADIRLSADKPALASFDIAALLELQQDSEAYGKALSAMLFAEPAVLAAFAKARAATAAQERVLRLRLFLDPAVPDLQSIRWEPLRDPKDGSPPLMGAGPCEWLVGHICGLQGHPLPEHALPCRDVQRATATAHCARRPAYGSAECVAPRSCPPDRWRNPYCRRHAPRPPCQDDRHVASRAPWH